MLQTKLFKFAVIGSLGFIVDFTLFSALAYLAHWDLMLARCCAFIGAASVTWLGNRLYTFKARPQQQKLTQWRNFFSAACLSAIPNLLTFKLVIHLWGQLPFAAYFALVVGVVAGMISNYWLSDKWVFASAVTSNKI